MSTKVELPEGRWLVVIKNGKAKIRNVDGRITFNAERFLEIKAKAQILANLDLANRAILA